MMNYGLFLHACDKFGFITSWNPFKHETIPRPPPNLSWTSVEMLGPAFLSQIFATPSPRTQGQREAGRGWRGGGSGKESESGGTYYI